VEDKQTYIRRETDRLLREWSARTAVLGAGIFLCLSLLDFFYVSDHAVRFLGYRIVVAAFLAATAAAMRRTQRRAVMHLLGFLGVLASVIALEAMILDFGGYHSPYLIGLILVAVVVAGLIPTGAGFAALSLGTIFVVYVVPIFLWDTVSDPAFFTVNTVLFFCVLASGVLVRWFHQKHLVSQISLRHDLIKSRENLEIEIAQRKQSDTERTSNEERLSLFAAAVEGAAEGISILDTQGRIVYCNTAAAGQLGRTPAEIIGQNIRQMYRDRALLETAVLPALLSTGRWSGEIHDFDRTGKPILLWLTASLVRNPEGRAIAMIGLTRDLADQKKLEDEHVRTQKIESVGVLAGGLAHDFNNLLTIILGNLDLARLFAGTNPDVAEALDHAAEAALRAGDLTRQLITFSKGGQPVKRVGSIARMLRETVLFAASGSNIACELAISENLPLVDFDEGQMRQVIHNFVQNAREAMPGGGTLKVGAGAILLARGEIVALPAGRYLRLEFTDHGTGIAQEHLNLIFDPYFSTKEMGPVKGRGLGLAVSYSIVHNHGGTITAVSVIGKGTTIAVYLPESTRAAEEEEEDSDEPEPAWEVNESANSRELAPEPLPVEPARGRVLIMDDEPLVLEMAGAAVRRLGYAATLSRSGAEAIVQYQIGLDSGRRFDAVILDLTVPGGIGGPETVARLRQIDPGVRAALSSGYTDHPAVTDWASAGFAAFIAKPYSLKAFEDLLAKLV
jgi:PAS domain S-box-containing protein